MEYYITAMRAAAEKCSNWELKPVFDYLLGQAKEDFQAGALDMLEYYNIVNEYADTLKIRNAINYVRR